MAYFEEKKFTFESKASGIAADTFAVASFKGEEGMSRLYRFEITLVSKEAEIDLEALLSNPATLYLRPDQQLPVHGIVISFEQLHEVDENVFYRAVLVPRLWQLTQFDLSEVYLDMTFPEIIEQVLQEGGLSTNDYRLELKRANSDNSFPYRKWSYVCQYQESHFNFISRWMEREGIYYYFEQGDDCEVLVITDSKTIHSDLPDEKVVHYSPVSGLEAAVQKEAATAFMCRQKPLPQKVVLQDFNYRKSPPLIQGEAEVLASGKGEVYIYGEHVKDNDEAANYAMIRAEELICGQKVFHGETTVTFLRPGFFFELDTHYRDSYNQKYLLVGISHEGSQSALLMAGVSKSRSEGDEKPFYQNTIEAILPDVQFRPERTTPRPRFYGTINAKVEAEGSGEYAELDEFGRYKVKLPFDRSDRAGQKASRWVRMAQPYAGPDEGMHFPLRKGAEVILTFMDGDPDRPLIAGAVPGAEGQSVVTDKNSTRNTLKSAGGNFLEFQDQKGKERIFLSTPSSNTFIHLGAPNSPTNTLVIHTENENLIDVGQNFYVEVGADVNTEGYFPNDFTNQAPVNTDGNMYISVKRDFKTNSKGSHYIETGDPTLLTDNTFTPVDRRTPGEPGEFSTIDTQMQGVGSWDTKPDFRWVLATDWNTGATQAQKDKKTDGDYKYREDIISERVVHGSRQEIVYGDLMETQYGMRIGDTYGHTIDSYQGNIFEIHDGNEYHHHTGSSWAYNDGSVYEYQSGDVREETRGKKYEKIVVDSGKIAEETEIWGDVHERLFGSKGELHLGRVGGFFLGNKLELDIAMAVAVSLSMALEFKLFDTGVTIIERTHTVCENGGGILELKKGMIKLEEKALKVSKNKIEIDTPPASAAGETASAIAVATGVMATFISLISLPDQYAS